MASRWPRAGYASIDHPVVLQTIRMGNTLTQHWVEQDKHNRPEQHLRFQGQYFDVETGLRYNRSRYYDKDVGRFVSQDPIGLAGGYNVYQYTPNPTGWIDPLGLCKCDCREKTDAEKRAIEIHQKVPEATQSRTTIAVTPTKEGVTIVSSSEARLRPAQRASLKPNEIEAKGPGHAEITGLNTTVSLGLNTIGTAASRPICCNCQDEMGKRGVPPLSPRKKR